MTRYTFAGEVEAIARNLIDEHHEELMDADIECYFVANYDAKGLLKDAKPGDTLAWQQVIPRQFRALHKDMGHFTVGVLLSWWQKAKPAQRLALVDHCLCHLEFAQSEAPGDLPDTCRIVKHNFEGFQDELLRHGCWTEELQEARAQLSLFEGDLNVTVLGETIEG